MNGKKFRFIILIFICSHVFAWDSIDFELFDLVEDVKTNFYEILGVSQVSLTLCNLTLAAQLYW